MSDCCPESELIDTTAQLLVEDDCTVVVEVEAGGPPGPQGPAATITVGSTSTLAPGSSATVANSGTSGAAIFDFGIPQGIQGPIGPVGPGGVNAVYGSFYDLGYYPGVIGPTSAFPIHLGVTLEAFGMSIVNDLSGDPTIIQLQLDGTYELGYSIQFTNTGSNANLASVWLRVNGVDIADSRSQFSVPGKHGSDNGSLIGTVNYLSSYIGTEQVQLMWQTESSLISIETIPAGTTPDTPVSPGIIVTVARIAQQGSQGPAATIAVGTTTTLAAGSSATVGNSGTSGAAIFDFGIPEGEPATATAGTTTTLSPGSPATVTNVGTTQNAIFDFGVPEGIQGIQGDAATIAAGTTTTVSPSTPAAVTNSGTSSVAVFDFDIPQGVDGLAATIAVGTTTTLSAGSTATVGNSGSSSAAVFDFGIPEGIQGIQGIQGDAATIAAGSTTTVSAGTPASVTNSGTSSAAIFDFDVPRGFNGIEVDNTAPVDTTILWADTGEPGDMVLPLGGLTGQALVKVSGSDYDTDWASVSSDPTEDNAVIASRFFV